MLDKLNSALAWASDREEAAEGRDIARSITVRGGEGAGGTKETARFFLFFGVPSGA